MLAMSSYVFLDIGPVAQYHTLIIPKCEFNPSYRRQLLIRLSTVHTERMDELDDKYLGEILPIAKKVAKAIGCKDYNILQASSLLL
jgi:diadenosine tetraphosphate (Ap4A) HIT family hydrolase